MPSRLALSAVLVFAAAFGQIAHQGKWHQRPPEARVSRSTPLPGRLIRPMARVTTRAARFRVVPIREHAQRRPLVSRVVFLEWLKVATCETGRAWRMVGPVYSGALGILNANWLAYAPLSFPRNASLATPIQQVYVATLINRGYPVPDQYGCSGGW